VICAGCALALALLLALVLLWAGVRQLAWAWLMGISMAAFAAYAYDKLAARSGWLRVPERVLLLLALLGGSLGAVVAMLAFRHKTRKGPFLLRLLLVLLGQGGALLVWRLGIQS
jgi:uncharacterized membrane protein YsdA (DUF1294 family)